MSTWEDRAENYYNNGYILKYVRISSFSFQNLNLEGQTESRGDSEEEGGGGEEGQEGRDWSYARVFLPGYWTGMLSNKLELLVFTQVKPEISF